MILDIKVDLSECYAENFEGDPDLGISATASLSDEIKEVVQYEVKKAISKQIKDDVSSLAIKAYRDFGEEKIKSIVDFKMNEFILDGKVKKSFRSDELISVNEKLRSIFDDSGNWKAPYDAIKEVGKSFAKECRDRYDLSFASNIVTGLEKQGLLKPGAFEAITKDNQH